MNKIQEPKCCLCGDETKLGFKEKIENGYTQNILIATCIRCGYSMRIRSLEDMRLEELTNKLQ